MLFYLHNSRKCLNFAVVNELERHIEVLLLENDCVIVPNFGGFMTHHVDARFDASDESFLPPFRTLGFNPQLKMNDSLLIHSYIDAYNLSYPEAMQRVADEVDSLWEQLRTDGYYELNNIGTLALNDNGNIEFTPNEAGILTPDYYGLSSFEMHQLKKETIIDQAPLPALQPETAKEEKEEEEKASVLAIDESADDEGSTITLRVAWIRNAVAIAAAILAFFLITTPVSNEPVGLQQANMASLQPVQKPQPQPAVATTDSVKVDSVEAEPQQPEPQEPVATSLTDAATEYYTVVLASQVSKANALLFIEQLQKQGYTGARLYTRNKVNRVVFGHYASESEAYQMVNKFRDHEEYDLAWVMKIKE